MKHNAILRIIIWSICLVLLSSMLLGVLAFHSVRLRRTDTVAYTEVSDLYSPGRPVYMHSAVDETNVRTAPNPDASVVGMLQPGEIVTVENETIVNEISWSRISSPIAGWVQTQFIAMETAVETSVSNSTAGSIAFDADKVHSLDIEWVAGRIHIQPAETDEILISESTVSTMGDAMVWKLKEGQLSIDFTQEDDHFFIFGNHSNFSKDLTIYVPSDWHCASLEIDAASTDVEVEGLSIGAVEFDGASGICHFNNCTVDRIDMDTASGDVRFSGTLNSLEFDGASANVCAVLANTPNRLDIETMSGDLDITLPEDAGFTVSMDTMSSHFDSEFETTMQNNNHVCGDGRCRIAVSAMSGDVIIRKAPSAS